MSYSVTRVSYRYHIAVSPLDGSLYISDPESHQILKVKNPNNFSDPDHNWEPAVGSGERCLPGDEAHCGDGALARDAKLAYPKGIIIIIISTEHILPIKFRFQALPYLRITFCTLPTAPTSEWWIKTA